MSVIPFPKCPPARRLPLSVSEQLLQIAADLQRTSHAIARLDVSNDDRLRLGSMVMAMGDMTLQIPIKELSENLSPAADETVT